MGNPPRIPGQSTLWDENQEEDFDSADNHSNGALNAVLVDIVTIEVRVPVLYPQDM